MAWPAATLVLPYRFWKSNAGTNRVPCANKEHFISLDTEATVISDITLPGLHANSSCVLISSGSHDYASAKQRCHQAGCILRSVRSTPAQSHPGLKPETNTIHILDSCSCAAKTLLNERVGYQRRVIRPALPGGDRASPLHRVRKLGRHRL